MSTPSQIKRYAVKSSFRDYHVTLEVDHSILTPERAQMINSFWSEADARANAEDGDMVRAVIRFAGLTLINIMLTQGGADFSEKTTNPVLGISAGPLWTKDLHDEEGWGGATDGEPFGWCGIRCIAAAVETPEFDDLDLEQLA